MGEPQDIKSICTAYTPKPPCCIELYPFDRSYAAVGTYDLLSQDGNAEPEHENSSQERQLRDGAVMLYKATATALEPVQTVDLPFAVLDVHWVTLDTQTAVLGAAASAGCIALLKAVHAPPAPPALEWIQTLQVEVADMVITSFVWRPDDKGIVYSAADGAVYVLPAVLSAGQLSRSAASPLHHEPLVLECSEDTVEIAQHELEAWIVALDLDHKGVWSGGDDAALSWQALPQTVTGNLDDDDEPRVSWASKRIHDAGVTAVMPLLPGVLLTGSYDDKLRVLGMPTTMPGRVSMLADANLEGGVWRIYVLGGIPADLKNGQKLRLLVCCMYAGARIVEIEKHNGSQWGVRVVASFTEHESMCYGGAILSDKDNRFLTCSFYDKRLCLWAYVDK